MEYNYSFLNKQEYALSTIQENIEFVIYSLASLLMPFIFMHMQILVGTAVNTALVLAALNMKNYKLLPVIVCPSIGAVAGGLLFGSFTPFLLYMIPAIWIGNFILIMSFKKFMVEKKKNRIMVLAGASAAKAAFLFVVAGTLVFSGILPKPFLIAMGPMQLATALIGGAVALGIQMAKKNIA